MPSPTLDSVSVAFQSILTGVGTLQAVLNRSPYPLPYQGATPALFFPPLSGPAEFGGMAARQDNYRGYIVMTYLDKVPSQQSVQAGTTVPTGTIETAMMANLEAIIGAIIANPKLNGAVVFAGAIPAERGGTFSSGHPIRIKSNGGGPFKDDYGGQWVSFELSVPFIGKGETV